MKKHPIYNIQNFKSASKQSDFYINTFKEHLKEHEFIEKPHRHNFYLLVVFTKGSGIHEIDFDRYEIKAGSLFVLQPGQIHHWQLSEDIEGYIIFFKQEAYNFYFRNKKIEAYPFYDSVNNKPELQLNADELNETLPLLNMMVIEKQQQSLMREDKFWNLLDLILIEISKKYLSENNHITHSYNYKIKTFELLLEQHFKTEKSPSFYASKMNMTLKHLNRICKNILDKTATEIITQRVVLEAKRLLINPNKSINQIADELGFVNIPYFTQLFKKSTNITPSTFRNELKK